MPTTIDGVDEFVAINNAGTAVGIQWPEPGNAVSEVYLSDLAREVAAQLGMADRVHLAGFRRDVGDVLDAIDLFAVSSDREGFANAMLEAMAFGIPVVSTDVSGAREALDAAPGEPRAGIVTGFSEAELAEAIGGLIRDPDARRRMGDAARARAERRFGEERFLDEWERLLEDGVRARRGE